VTVADYGQCGEQTAILAWAQAQQQPGSFVDLGAYDGRSYSNTAALAEASWSGICVDAAPDAAAACAELYADRDDVRVILAAFTADGTGGTVTVYWSPGAMYSALKPRKRPDLKLVPIEIPQLDHRWFAHQVDSLPRPLFCSIDLEGGSLDALEWMLEYGEPDAVCVEANNPAERSTVRSWLGGWTEVPIDGHTNLLFTR